MLESYDNNASDMIVFSNGLLVYSSLPKDITGLFAQYFFGTGDPYRFDLNAWVFVFAGLGVVLIALITVGLQALRAAIADPVESLRYE